VACRPQTSLETVPRGLKCSYLSTSSSTNPVVPPHGLFGACALPQTLESFLISRFAAGVVAAIYHNDCGRHLRTASVPLSLFALGHARHAQRTHDSHTHDAHTQELIEPKTPSSRQRTSPKQALRRYHGVCAGTSAQVRAFQPPWYRLKACLGLVRWLKLFVFVFDFTFCCSGGGGYHNDCGRHPRTASVPLIAVRPRARAPRQRTHDSHTHDAHTQKLLNSKNKKFEPTYKPQTSLEMVPRGLC
jgi:hypothetical protein